MYCKKCGKQLSDKMRFCPDCGTDNGVSAGNKRKEYKKIEENFEKETDNVSREGATYASISLLLLIFGILSIFFVPAVSIACLIFSVVISILARGKVKKGSKEDKEYDLLTAVGIILLIIFILLGTVLTHL